MLEGRFKRERLVRYRQNVLMFQISRERICVCINNKLKIFKSAMEDNTIWPSVNCSFSLPFGEG